MTFDPAKPVAYCLYEGKQCEVRNFRRRDVGDNLNGSIEAFPFACDIYREKHWYRDTFTFSGNSYFDDHGVYQLVNAPEPVGVDWGQAIQYRNRTDIKLRYIHAIDPPTVKGHTRAVLEELDNHCAVSLRHEDGRSESGNPDYDIINVPSPPRVLTVEIAGATHPGREGDYLAVYSKDGGVTLTPILSANLKPIRFTYDLYLSALEHAVESGWKFHDHQSLPLTLGE